jgi:hypothetical protein
MYVPVARRSLSFESRCSNTAGYGPSRALVSILVESSASSHITNPASSGVGDSISCVENWRLHVADSVLYFDRIPQRICTGEPGALEKPKLQEIEGQIEGLLLQIPECMKARYKQLGRSFCIWIMCVCM